MSTSVCKPPACAKSDCWMTVESLRSRIASTCSMTSGDVRSIFAMRSATSRCSSSGSELNTIARRVGMHVREHERDRLRVLVLEIGEHLAGVGAAQELERRRDHRDAETTTSTNSDCDQRGDHDDGQRSFQAVCEDRTQLRCPGGSHLAMWTEAEHLRSGMDRRRDDPVAKMDVRVGGSRLVCMEVQTSQGRRCRCGHRQVREVVANARLVVHGIDVGRDGNVVSPSDMGMPEGHPITTEISVELEDVDGRTRMVIDPCWDSRRVARCGRMDDGIRQAAPHPSNGFRPELNRNARCAE